MLTVANSERDYQVRQAPAPGALMEDGPFRVIPLLLALVLGSQAGS